MKAASWAAVVALLAGSAAADAQVVTKQYDDGGVYEGTFRNGRQHGQGSYQLPNGYRYEGDWVKGEILGQGRATFPNGSVYEGQFAEGKPNGTGTITYADGGTYESKDAELTGAYYLEPGRGFVPWDRCSRS